MTLNLSNLKKISGNVKSPKRVGRGRSGKRPGHGGKGQTARTGVALGNFQGGQTPIERRLPKQIRFHLAPKFDTVTIKTIDRLILSGKIDSSSVVNCDVLRKAKVISKLRKFKLVGNDECSKPFTVEANAASKAAIESIKKASGQVRII